MLRLLLFLIDLKSTISNCKRCYRGNFTLKSNSNKIMLWGGGGQQYLVLYYFYGIIYFFQYLYNIFHVKDSKGLSQIRVMSNFDFLDPYMEMVHFLLLQKLARVLLRNHIPLEIIVPGKCDYLTFPYFIKKNRAKYPCHRFPLVPLGPLLMLSMVILVYLWLPSKQCDYFYGYMTSHIPIKMVIYFLTWSFTTFYGQ